MDPRVSCKRFAPIQSAIIHAMRSQVSWMSHAGSDRPEYLEHWGSTSSYPPPPHPRPASNPSCCCTSIYLTRDEDPETSIQALEKIAHDMRMNVR